MEEGDFRTPGMESQREEWEGLKEKGSLASTQSTVVSPKSQGRAGKEAQGI